MKDMLLGISQEYLYLHRKQPKEISDLHKPYFLAFCSNDSNITSARYELLKKWKEKSSSKRWQICILRIFAQRRVGKKTNTELKPILCRFLGRRI